MLQCFYLMFTLFISSKNVYGLMCYTSDFKTLQLGNIKNLSYELHDCNNYNNNVKQVSPELQIPENVTLHCYTVEVSRDVIVRGCVQSGGCHFLMDTVKNVVRQFGTLETEDSSANVAKMQCIECDEDKCNKNQIKYEKIDTAPPERFTAPRSETSLECYYCSEPCEISKASKKICGRNIGKSHEAVCTKEVSTNSSTQFFAVRKCTVVPKDIEPPCPDGSVCTYCKNDLCNREEIVQAETSLECYYCSEPCEISKASKKICGGNIGKSHEPICTKEVSRNSSTQFFAVRKCTVVPKDMEPPCPDGSVCTYCKNDLCNKEEIVQAETSLECYYCSEPCEISKASKKICGGNIGKSHEPICTKEVSRNSSTQFFAVRKCTVVPKDMEPPCPDGSVCTYCKNDLCNKEEIVQGEALKCYTCEACEVSKAQEKTCGQSIGDSHEAVCTTEVAKDSKNVNVAKRQCKIITKGTQPECPATADCKSCKTDLCNAASSIGSKTAIVGVLAAFLATKLLLH